MADSTFVKVWTDAALWDDLGPKMTCMEAEALGEALVDAGADPAVVRHLIDDLHGQGDNEPDDDHHCGDRHDSGTY